MSKIDVSVIIVNYNTKLLLQNCLDSVYSQTGDIFFEVIVSDNGSTDGSIEMVKVNFPNVILIENNTNLGFGTANNRGLKIAQGKYILYLNSDTVLKNNAVKCFYDYWEAHSEEKIGALGCNLLDENGTYAHSFGDLPNTKKFVFEPIRFFITSLVKSFFMMTLHKIPSLFITKPNYIKYVGKVGYITGADLFLKNDKNAYFDERYFMYYEESDLELNIHKQGLEMRIIEEPEIFHLEKGSDKGKIQYSFSSIFNEISRIKYYRKNGDFLAKLCIPFVKVFVILTWLNPYYFSKTKKYFGIYIKA